MRLTLIEHSPSLRFSLTGEVFGQGYLEATSDAVTKHIGSNSSGGGEVKLLNAITEPVTKLIIQVC